MVTLHENQHVFLGQRVSIHALVKARSIVALVRSYGETCFPYRNSSPVDRGVW